MTIAAPTHLWTEVPEDIAADLDGVEGLTVDGTVAALRAATLDAITIAANLTPEE